MNRRHFLATAVASLLAACTRDPQPVPSTSTTGSTLIPPTTTPPLSTTTEPTLVERLHAEVVALSAYPYELGIASGDPTSDAVMIWTRLAGSLPAAVPLVWEVGLDEDFASLLATGRVLAVAESSHRVRVDCTGLPSDHSLFYRFRIGGESGDVVSPIGRTKTFATAGTPTSSLRLAVSSCQNSIDGAYAAHRSIAVADVDAVVWLGDYIYTGSNTLEEYQDAYDRYHRDPHLQAAHAAHPWIMIWDDNEIQNDFDQTLDPQQRLAGMQAWRDNLPVRVPEPTIAGLDAYRSFVVGDLCHVLLLDTRQYGGDGALLGSTQRGWLLDALRHQTSWSIIASPVLASGFNTPTEEPLLGYTWDGAPDERRQLADTLKDIDSVIVSGDLHTSMVLDFKADPSDSFGEPVAPEFMAPAISSGFPAEYRDYLPFLPLFNPHLHAIEPTNGWLLLEITPGRIVATFNFVDDVTDPDSAVSSGPSYEVRSGENEARLIQ